MQQLNPECTRMGLVYKQREAGKIRKVNKDKNLLAEEKDKRYFNNSLHLNSQILNNLSTLKVQQANKLTKLHLISKS